MTASALALPVTLAAATRSVQLRTVRFSTGARFFCIFQPVWADVFGNES